MFAFADNADHPGRFWPTLLFFNGAFRTVIGAMLLIFGFVVGLEYLSNKASKWDVERDR